MLTLAVYLDLYTSDTGGITTKAALTQLYYCVNIVNMDNNLMKYDKDLVDKLCYAYLCCTYLRTVSSSLSDTLWDFLLSTYGLQVYLSRGNLADRTSYFVHLYTQNELAGEFVHDHV